MIHEKPPGVSHADLEPAGIKKNHAGCLGPIRI